MRLAGISDQAAYKQAQSILIPLGEYFQVQDDYLDCYGSPEIIGKIGTDIQDNKCGWLINQALSRCSPQQRRILDENYGKNNESNVEAVKKVYHELNMEQIYREYEENSYKRISALIDQIDESILPKSMFVKFMNRIYKRNA